MAIDNAFALLFLGIVNGASIGSLLLFKGRNRLANALLSGFIFSLVFRMLIYIAGYQGVYDPHSWLYVPSIEISLVYGPFIYLYVRALILKGLPDRYYLHFIPVLVQVAYYLFLLFLPSKTQFEWVQNVHLTTVLHLETMLVVVSMAGYFYLAWRLYNEYQVWLGDQRSDSENFRLPWLKRFLICSAVFLCFWILFLLFDTLVEFTYQRHFLLFAVISLLLTYLAFESWRHSDQAIPEMALNDPDSVPRQSKRLKQLPDAALWLRALKEHEYWRDPELSLAGLAKKLGTNTSHLSAAINQHTGENFNAVVNQMRISSVCRKLKLGVSEGEIFKIALQEGFNSKNSFNRSFKRFTGMTPSQYRQKYSTKS